MYEISFVLKNMNQIVLKDTTEMSLSACINAFKNRDYISTSGICIHPESILYFTYKKTGE